MHRQFPHPSYLYDCRLLTTLCSSTIDLPLYHALKTLTRLRVFRGHANNVSDILFHPNPNRSSEFASYAEDRSVRIWEILPPDDGVIKTVQNNRWKKAVRIHDGGRGWALAVTPSGDTLIAGGDLLCSGIEWDATNEDTKWFFATPAPITQYRYPTPAVLSLRSRIWRETTSGIRVVRIRLTRNERRLLLLTLAIFVLFAPTQAKLFFLVFVVVTAATPYYIRNRQSRRPLLLLLLAVVLIVGRSYFPSTRRSLRKYSAELRAISDDLDKLIRSAANERNKPSASPIRMGR